MIIENLLASIPGFFFGSVKRTALTIGGVAAIGVLWGVGGNVHNWWENVQAQDETIEQQAGQIEDLTADLRLSEAAAIATRTAFERRETDLLRQVSLASADAANARLRVSRLTRRLQEISDAPEAMDGPLAPILRGTLERVRDDLRGLSPA